MSFLDNMNNVHVGFIQKTPLLWLPDGGDLRSLFGEDVKSVPKKALPQHLLIGNGSKKQGLMFIDMDACVLHLLLELYDELSSDSLDFTTEKIEKIAAQVRDELDSETDENLTALENWTVDRNYSDFKVQMPIYVFFEKQAAESKKNNAFAHLNFNNELKLALGLFIATEMPYEHCLSIPQLRNFVAEFQKLDLVDYIPEKMLNYFELFNGVLRHNKIGKINNKRGKTTWGYDLNDWRSENINRKPLGSDSGM